MDYHTTNGRLPSLDNSPDSLTEAQVRAIFQIPHASLFQSVKQGIFPSPIKIGVASKRWLKSQLVEFVMRQTEGSMTNE